MIDGYFDGAMKQFTHDLVDRYKNISDIDRLCEEVLQSPTRPKLAKSHKIQFCFVGLVKNKLDVKIVSFTYGRQPIKYRMRDKAFATGFKKPSERAMSLMNDLGVQEGLSKNKLRHLVKSTLAQ